MEPLAQTVVDWLMDSDPAIRWQVLGDVKQAPSAAVARERARVCEEGWGARLLSLQGEDGNWGGGSYTPKWTSTTYTLLLLRHFGADPAAETMRDAVERVRERVSMHRSPMPFFEYVGELCVTSMALSLGAYFLDHPRRLPQPDVLLDQQKADGGWNCRTKSQVSSFNTTISALDALLEYERAAGADAAVTAARLKAHEYLLERRLLYSKRTGELIDRRWTLLSFPPRWHYDVLRALDYLRDAQTDPDPRAADAVAIVEGKRRNDGTWPLQNHHAGVEHFPLEEGPGLPSRWNTLRALRVLDRFGARDR